jgi:hypothetical protein
MRVIIPLESSYNKMNMTNTTVIVRYEKAYLYQKKVFLYINNKTFVRIFIFNKTEMLNYHCAYTSWYSETCRTGVKGPEHS